MQLRIKKLHPDAVIPKQMTEGSAGFDLTAIHQRAGTVEWGSSRYEVIYIYSTGLAVEIPRGYVGLLFPRSSIWKTGMDLTNSVGVIDSDYRGEIQLVFRKRSMDESHYSVGDRVGQLVIVPLPSIELVEVSELTDTSRGSGGFGSTGQ